MKIKLLSILFCAVTAYGIAQEKGYFRKNTYLEFGANGQLPVFQNLFGQDKGYVSKSGELNKSYNIPDYSFRVALNSVVSENAAVGLELVQRYYAFNPLKAGELNRQYIDALGNRIDNYLAAKVAHVNLSETTILPKITFSNMQSRVPAGLTHEIGIGYSFIRFVDRNPLVELDSTAPFAASDVQANLLDNRVEELRGLVYLYGLRMNYPLTKSLLFSVGFRYQYSTLFKKKSFRDYEQTENWVSGRELWSAINKRRQWGIVSFGAGFTLCF